MAFGILIIATTLVASFASSGKVLAADDKDYDAKCFVFQEIALLRNPVLHFFSSREHTHATLGCSDGPTFELSPADKTDDFKLEKLEPEMKEKLVDSKLYNPNAITYFSVHGWLESWDDGDYSCRIKDLVLNNSEANFFILDWSGGSKPLNPVDYAFSVSATKNVAQLVGSFINSLIKITGTADATKFHLLGHSLGSHVVGFVGYTVPKVGRITGLDPAGPCFNSSGAEDRAAIQKTGHLADGRRRLSQQSAQLVVALHTDMAMFGLNEECAHYDVFINGAVKQPDCGLENLKQKLDLNKQITSELACPHRYSHEIVDTFARFLFGDSAPEPAADKELSSNSLGQKPVADQAEADKRCYEVAYKCDTSEAFELGECGLCFDDDEPDCLYIGLSSKTADSAPKFDGSGKKTDDNTVTCAKSEDNSDEKFNNEIQGKDELPPCAFLPSEENQIGHHFVKTGHARPLACLFQYQVVIAAEKSDVIEELYLQVPLQKSGSLKGSVGKQEDRLIKASHKLADESEAAKRIRKELPKVAGDVKIDGVDLYTALITFAVAECDDTGEFVPKSNQWELCSPLDSIKEGLLLGPKGSAAKSIQWATLSYLSGVEARTRLEFSYLFKSGDDKSADPQTSDKFGIKATATKFRKE